MFKQLGWPLLYGSVFATSILSSLLLARYIEHRFFPVVTDFVVTYSDKKENAMTVAGQMQKVRDCRFIEVVAYSSNQYLSVDFVDSPARQVGKSRAEGQQAWGPWLITPAASPIRLVARHQCHALWDSSTVLIEAL